MQNEQRMTSTAFSAQAAGLQRVVQHFKRLLPVHFAEARAQRQRIQNQDIPQLENEGRQSTGNYISVLLQAYKLP